MTAFDSWAEGSTSDLPDTIQRAVDDDASLQRQVAERIATLRRAHKEALFTLDNKPFKSTQWEATAKAIRSLKLPIESWATRGEQAARNGTSPSANGWRGWIHAGRIYADGINKVLDSGRWATLSDLTSTVARAPQNTVEGISDAAETVRDTIVDGAKALMDRLGNSAGTAAAGALRALQIVGVVLGVIVAVRQLQK